MATQINKQEMSKALDKMGERIALAEALQDFEDYLDANLARIIDEVDAEVFGPKVSPAPSMSDQVSTAVRHFVARFDAAFGDLMGSLFPQVSPVSVRFGTRSSSKSSDDKTPQKKVVLDGLPAWVVAPYGGAMEKGREFAILWNGKGDAPAFPTLALTLDRTPLTPEIGESVTSSQYPDLPPDITFVLFHTVTPTGVTIDIADDGSLAVDFATT